MPYYQRFVVLLLLNLAVYASLFAQTSAIYPQKEMLITVTDSITHKKGVCNTVGKLVISCEYDGLIINNTDEFIIARKGKLFGVITTENKVLLPFIYTTIYRIKSNKQPFYVVKEIKKPNEEKLINLKGEIIARGLQFTPKDSIGSNGKIYWANTTTNSVRAYEQTGEILGEITVNSCPLFFTLYLLDKQDNTAQAIFNVAAQEVFYKHQISSQDTSATIQLILKSSSTLYNLQASKIIFGIHRHREKIEEGNTFTLNKSEIDRTVVIVKVTIKQILVESIATQEKMLINGNWYYQFFLDFKSH